MAAVAWILLVEDDPDHRLLVREVVARHWPEVVVHEAVSVPEANEWLVRRKSESGLADGLLMLDLGLPGQSGFRLLEGLEENGLGIPAVVLTASENIMDAEHAFNYGAQGYYRKPTDFHDYVDMFRRVFERASTTDHEGVTDAV